MFQKLTFAISLVPLCIFLAISRGKFNDQTLGGLCCRLIWWALAAILIGLFCWAAWKFLENEVSRNSQMPDEKETKRIRGTLRDVHIAWINHANEEITRYRDLPWKVAVLNWGIYYGLHWLWYNDSLSMKLALPVGLFFILIFVTAISTTIFLLHFEVSANSNRAQRREIAEILGLHERWKPTKRGERLTRPGFLFSIFVFLLVVWCPPLIIIFYGTQP